MSFNGKRKFVRRLVPPFLKRALRLESVKGAVHFDGGETFRAEPEPLFLRRITVETVAPAFVIPAAGADVCFAGHTRNNVGGALVPRPDLNLHQATRAKDLSPSLSVSH